MLPSKTSGPTITSDASGSWGCGAFDHTSGQWFQYPWKEAWLPVNIAVKELLPIVISAALWGSRYKGCTVTFESDNQAVVSALTTRSVRHPHLMHLLRFFEAHFQFSHRATHIAGINNQAADALSRNNTYYFFGICSQAHPHPTELPEPLLELLTDISLTWTSPSWRGLFLHTLDVVSRSLPGDRTPQPSADT